MRIICISRGSFARGQQLAELLAQELDHPVLSREDLIEAAIDEGIHVGKLEEAMMKPRAFGERLALERDHYRAFSTVYLCERALGGPLVYHGRTGHLLLKEVSHLLRVRVIADQEYRIRTVMQRLGLDRDKAERYLSEVEEDRRNWVRSMYDVSWEDASHYDVVVNTEQMSVENAAAALVGMAQLPDFQLTPASVSVLKDVHLGAKARLLLARDERTYRAAFQVKAYEGGVTVTYLPKDAEVAEAVPRVLEELEEAKDIRVTMAGTNIVWIQETFDRTSEAFDKVAEIARKWSAAVELVRFLPGGGEEAEEAGEARTVSTVPENAGPPGGEYDGGIEEDEAETPDEGGLKAALDEMARRGRAGGARSVEGEPSLLLSCLGSSVPCSLVVLGDLFLEKGAEARMRLTRELQETVASRARVPVVTADELGKRYLFGRSDLFRMVGFLLVVLLLYILVMSNQEPILQFLSGNWTGGDLLRKLLVSAAVFLFVPIVAYSYGSVARSVMKLIKME